MHILPLGHMMSLLKFKQKTKMTLKKQLQPLENSQELISTMTLNVMSSRIIVIGVKLGLFQIAEN